MTPDKKMEIIHRLQETAMDLRKYAKELGDVRFCMSIANDVAHIIVYDKEINVRFAGANWHDPIDDPDWLDLAGPEGWTIDMGEY